MFTCESFENSLVRDCTYPSGKA